MMSYANYLYIAIRAAVDAGKSIMDIYNDPESDFGIERKADNSPLTKADKAAHRLITNALSVTPFPVLSEEGKEIPFKERSKWETLWIVDPLDGTKEFIKKNGEFTVNIALVEKGVPVLGVIYVPVRKELYFASSSVGAYKFTGIDSSSQPSMDEMKQRAIHLPMALAHQGVVVVASRSHQTEETTAFIDNLRKQGRILLPANLREYAGIDKEVVSVGVFSRVEIWSKERYLENNDFDDMDEIAEHMAELGIGI